MEKKKSIKFYLKILFKKMVWSWCLIKVMYWLYIYCGSNYIENLRHSIIIKQDVLLCEQKCNRNTKLSRPEAGVWLTWGQSDPCEAGDQNQIHCVELWPMWGSQAMEGSWKKLKQNENHCLGLCIIWSFILEIGANMALQPVACAKSLEWASSIWQTRCLEKLLLVEQTYICWIKKKSNF